MRRPILQKRGLAIDAVEAAINHVELLPDEFYVGLAAFPTKSEKPLAQ